MGPSLSLYPEPSLESAQGFFQDLRDSRELTMKSRVSSGSEPGMTKWWQRLLAMLFIALFAYMIWAAVTGRYDLQVDWFASWLHQHWLMLRRWVG